MYKRSQTHGVVQQKNKQEIRAVGIALVSKGLDIKYTLLYIAF